jgi:hypothetical protein
MSEWIAFVVMISALLYVLVDDMTDGVVQRRSRKTLNAELYRVRTTQQAAAHALDTLRQHYGLDLIDGEHPMDTAKRIREAVTPNRESTPPA